MRIENNYNPLKKTMYSSYAAIFFTLISAFFIYKCITLLPIWLRTKDSLVVKEQELYKKEEEVKRLKISLEEKTSDLGKERYQKEFFNKLEEGEELIILYENEKPVEKAEEKELKLFWWDEMKQKFLVWWKNSEISKK